MGARYGWSEPPDDDNVGYVMMRIIEIMVMILVMIMRVDVTIVNSVRINAV